MTSAWGNSWGASWGDSWGTITANIAYGGADNLYPRRRRYGRITFKHLPSHERQAMHERIKAAQAAKVPESRPPRAIEKAAFAETASKRPDSSGEDKNAVISTISQELAAERAAALKAREEIRRELQRTAEEEAQRRERIQLRHQAQEAAKRAAVEADNFARQRLDLANQNAIVAILLTA